MYEAVTEGSAARMRRKYLSHCSAAGLWGRNSLYRHFSTRSKIFQNVCSSHATTLGTESERLTLPIGCTVKVNHSILQEHKYSFALRRNLRPASHTAQTAGGRERKTPTPIHTLETGQFHSNVIMISEARTQSSPCPAHRLKVWRPFLQPIRPLQW